MTRLLMNELCSLNWFVNMGSQQLNMMLGLHALFALNDCNRPSQMMSCLNLRNCVYGSCVLVLINGWRLECRGLG
jgi:hypothetical protein